MKLTIEQKKPGDRWHKMSFDMHELGGIDLKPEEVDIIITDCDYIPETVTIEELAWAYRCTRMMLPCAEKIIDIMKKVGRNAKTI